MHIANTITIEQLGRGRVRAEGEEGRGGREEERRGAAEEGGWVV